MPLISTWTCVWLLLKLSLIGHASSLRCWRCDDDQRLDSPSCRFHTIGTRLFCSEDEEAENWTCLVVFEDDGKPGNDTNTKVRTCIHKLVLEKMGGPPSRQGCTTVLGQQVVDALEWGKANNLLKEVNRRRRRRNIEAGAQGRSDFFLNRNHKVCSCNQRDLCNVAEETIDATDAPPTKKHSNGGALHSLSTFVFWISTVIAIVISSLERQM